MRRLILPMALLLMGVAGDNGINGGGSVTDRSGTITTSSTSQVVMAANPKRVYCEIQLPGADVWVAIDQAASNSSGSYYLPSNSLFRCSPDAPPTGAISIWTTAASGAKFTATEYSR